MAKKMNSNIVIFLVLGILGAVFFAFKLGTQKKELEQKAGEIAVREGLNYVKSQSDVTKDWFNQLGNTWKQIWK